MVQTDTMNEERYLVTVTFNVYACSDQAAEVKAQDAADYLAETYVGYSHVVNIERAPAGDLRTYPIKP